MPHTILEYSSNIKEKDNFSDLFKQIHQLLIDKFHANISACKSRAIEYQDFLVGNGEDTNFFVCLTIKILSGRSQEAKNNFTQSLSKILQNHFQESIKEGLKITIEIVELQFYHKL
jgi:5-carboxymethyl-2-hydroxymuconate isomerase